MEYQIRDSFIQDSNYAFHNQVDDPIMHTAYAIRSWVIVVLTMMVLGTSCAPSGPVITIEPSVSSLQVNDTARASVTVENITDLTAFEAHLSFDANALEVIE